MSVMQCACPKCAMQLQIAQALPVNVQCPGCQTVFTVGGPAPAAASAGQAIRRTAPRPPAPEPENPFDVHGDDDEPPVRRRTRSRGTAMPWLIACFGVLALGGIVLAVVLLRGGKTDDQSEKIAPRTNERQAKINEAVARGVHYLRKQILEGKNRDYYVIDQGADIGVIALAGLTLLECDVPPGDEAVRRAEQDVRGAAPRLTFTYSLALSILFLDRLTKAKSKAEPADRELIQRFAVQLMAAQNTSGGWGYNSDTLKPGDHERLLKAINAGQKIPPSEQERIDNSINQFVTLALWAARNHQVKTDAALKRTEALYRKTQHTDGSWGYVGKSTNLPDATTCAGLIGLAVGNGVDFDAKAHKVPVDVSKDPAVKKALEFLGKKIGITRLGKADLKHQQDLAEQMLELHRKYHEGPADERPAIKKELAKLDSPSKLRGTYVGASAWGDLYFLWSVERVAVLFNLKEIGGKDWYTWGADVIVKHQRPDGSWRDRFPGICDTCFALLFLKRANVAKDLTDKLQEARRLVIGAAPAPPLPVPAAPLSRPREA